MLDDYCLLCGNDSLELHYNGIYECSECGWSMDEDELDVFEEDDELDEFDFF